MKSEKYSILKKENLLSFFGGLIFVIIFIWGYSFIDNNWYEYRDDGVITMSVARNLVDAGFIGVGVSGPIVEASSSPMQIFVYALAYLLTGVDYIDFSYWQTVIATFLIGFIFIRFFSDQPKIAIAIAIISAFGLTLFYSFFEWHASGMENAITHILFLATIYILYKSVKDNSINYWLAIVIFFATIARLDSVYHIAILLIIYSIYWKNNYKTLQALNFSFIVFLLWALFQFWRYYYFGDLRSNTAYAQNISMDSVLSRLELLIYGGTNYLNSILRLAWDLFVKQAGLLVFALIFFVYSSKYTKGWIEVNIDKNYKFILILSISIMTSSFFTPILFGLARLDRARTTTQLTLIIFLFLSVILYSSKIKYNSNFISLKVKLERTTLSLLSIVAIIATSIYYYEYNKAYRLNYSTTWFNKTHNKLINIAKDNNIDRPTVSSPDLGVVTWHKKLNIIDLGKLGSPVMAKLHNRQMMTEYYLKYALPDIIEAHGSWIQQYCDSIFTKEDFKKLYSQIDSQFDMVSICSSGKYPVIYWIRNDIMRNSSSFERKLLNNLQNNLSVKQIKNEISACYSTDFDCSYIARTVYKFIPELRKTDKFEKVYKLFNSERDKALLRGWKDGQAHKVIMDSVKNRINIKEPL